jgi:transposase
MKAMANRRTYSVEFKRQIVQDFMAGDTLHTLARRHDISRNLVRLWVWKFEAGAFDDDARAADLLQDCEAKIAALERMVGRQALEIEFLKGALKSVPRPRSARVHPSSAALWPLHRRRMSADGPVTLDLLRRSVIAD